MNNIYKNSKTIHFENKDIIITDPCYILKKDNEKIDNWKKCQYGEKMEVFGINNYITHSTIIGDCTWYVRNIDNNSIIGMFSADAGLMSVFDLEEVLKYNPEYDIKKQEEFELATMITNFTGDVYIDANKDSITATVIGNGTTNFMSILYEEDNNEENY